MCFLIARFSRYIHKCIGSTRVSFSRYVYIVVVTVSSDVEKVIIFCYVFSFRSFGKVEK